MRRICAIVILLLMLIEILPVISSAAKPVASGTCGADLTWTLDDEGTLTIKGTGPMDNYITQQEYDSIFHSKVMGAKAKDHSI